ncbi:MAG: sigma-70 family RNA polymerase sigma factor [Candidatus Eremiobacterota bacterium]
MMDPETLANEHYQRILAYATGMLRNRSQAEDVTQEVFLRAQERQRQFRGESSSSTWLYAIASNLCLDAMRRRSSLGRLLQRLGVGVDRIRSHEDPLLAREASQRILARLKPQSRQVLLLRVHLELSYEEIAEVLSISLSHVGVLLHRARREALEAARKEGIEL